MMTLGRSALRQACGALALLLLLGVSAALAEVPPTKAPGVPVGTGTQPVVIYDAAGNVVSSFGGGSGGTTTTSGAIQPPTAAAGKITQTSVTLSANTSTQLVAARATSGDRIAVEVQCDGTAVVGIDRTGGTLTSATAAPLVIPSGLYPLYTMPIATQTAITAYTGTGQVCRVTEYLR